MSEAASPVQDVSLSSNDRILVLAPHPDDDVLGCAGVIQKAKTMGIPVHVIYLTNGDMNEWAFLIYRKRPVLTPHAALTMGEVRHDEAVQAAQVLGLAASDLIFLGYPDFGTMNIWYRHWNDASPYRSLLTKVTKVPYANAYRPGAPYKGEDIVEDLEALLRDYKPTKIFVSHPGDHNADHRALYLFMKIALWDLNAEINPEIYPYIIHFKSWPRPAHYHPDAALTPPGLFAGEIPWRSLALSVEEVAVKEKAIRQHRSQFISSGLYLNSFVRRNEIFGDFPVVRLAAEQKAALPADSKEEMLLNSSQLSDNQKVSLVGVVGRTVAVKNRQIEITLHLSRPMGQAVGTSVYIYGYRHDRPFKGMPKLLIKVGPVLYDVFDQRNRLSERLITVRRAMKTIVITVPLEVAGYPEKILTSAQTYLGKVPLDWLSWRIVELQ
jgi:LmbE family N-acetylglucosaminyl deacetylase